MSIGKQDGYQNPPLISIVVCTFNRAHVIRETISSLLAQRYWPVEILVVDDGSTDETARVLAEFRDDIRSHILARNVGIARARSEACRLALGQYIAFQDDDDLMPPDRLVVLWNALKDFPDAVFSVGDLALIDEHGRLTGTRWLPASSIDTGRPQLVRDAYRAVLWPTLPVVPHTTLFRRADGERVGWFDERFRNAAEDKDFFARLARLGPVVYVPKVVSWVRRGHVSLTQNAAKAEAAALELYRKHMQLINEGDAADPQLYRRLQLRMVRSLERLARERRRAGAVGKSTTTSCESRYLSLLSPTLRARYAWRTRVSQPIRTAWRSVARRGGSSQPTSPADRTNP